MPPPRARPDEAAAADGASGPVRTGRHHPRVGGVEDGPLPRERVSRLWRGTRVRAVARLNQCRYPRTRTRRCLQTYGGPEIFAPRQVVERFQIEEPQETVGRVVVRRAPLGVRPLDPQQAAADQVGQDVAAGLAPQAADLLAGDRLLIGHQRQHVDGGLRQPGLADAAVETVAQGVELAAKRQPVAVPLADDPIRRAGGVVAAVQLVDQARGSRRPPRRASVRPPGAAKAAGCRDCPQTASPPRWSAD